MLEKDSFLDRTLLEPKTVQGNISEVYLSLQGEGLWVGLPMVFVRMSGCHRRCRYCDTEYALVKEPLARFWSGLPRPTPDQVERNPVAADVVMEWILSASQGWVSWISLTGGEPLLQSDFVAALASQLSRLGFQILLETEGGLPDRLRRVLPWLSAVSTDIKLPSTTGEELDWDASAQFLRLVADAPAEKVAKMVVTADIREEEFIRAVHLLSEIDPTFPLVLQPVTPARFVTDQPGSELLLRLASLAQRYLKDVRIVPQVHKFFNLA